MKKISAQRAMFILIPVFMFVIMLFFKSPKFAENDNVYMMNTLSGRTTGEPFACTSFINIFLGFIISSLYRIAWFPWFPIFIIICTLFGEMCIYDAVYGFIKNKGIPIFIKLALLITNLVISAFIMLGLSYTVASTLVGVVSTYLLHKGKRKLSIAMLLLSTAIRTESGFVACVFLVAMMLIKEQEASGTNNLFKLIKKIFWRVAIVVLAVVMISFTDEIIKHQIEPQGYIEFRNAQIESHDIGKNNEFINNKEKILKSIGWDDELYELHTIFYFSMDNRINTENLKVLASYKNTIFNFSLKSLLKYIKRTFYDASSIVFPFIIMILVIFYHLCILIKKKDLRFILFLLICIFTGILLMYLYILQRFIFRSWFSVVMPMLMISLIDMKDIEIEQSASGKTSFDILILLLSIALFLMGRFIIAAIFIVGLSWIRLKNKYIVTIISGFLIVACSTICYYELKNYYKLIAEFEYVGREKSIAEIYIAQNKDKKYIYGADLSMDIRMDVPNVSLYNMIAYGGTNVNSATHEQKLKKSGLKNYDISELTADDVYLLEFVNMRGDISVISKLMKSKGYNGEFKLYERINGSDIEIFKYYK